MNTGEDRNKDRFLQTESLRSLKAPVLWPQSDKGHSELCFIYQSVYQLPWAC